MKRFLIIFCLCVSALHLSSANRFNNMRECIASQGFENKKEIMQALMQSKVDTLQDVSKEKLACVVACQLHKENKRNQTIHTMLSEVINYVFNAPEDTKKQMLDTLNTCQIQAGNDDCKLLDCVKITESPFLDLFVVITHVPLDGKFCILASDLVADDIRKIRKAITNPEALDERAERVKACLMGCVFHKTKKPGQEISSIISDAITTDASIPVDQKKSMWDTLSACIRKVGINECKLLDCIKISSDPFKSVIKTVQKSINENSDWLVWVTPISS